jgi:hypothetical protein
MMPLGGICAAAPLAQIANNQSIFFMAAVDHGRHRGDSGARHAGA